MASKPWRTVIISEETGRFTREQIEAAVLAAMAETEAKEQRKARAAARAKARAAAGVTNGKTEAKPHAANGRSSKTPKTGAAGVRKPARTTRAP
jgi:hypothetical protein